VLAHRTRFVEIGPVTALSATAAATLLPFPDLRMGWGLDARWAAIAAEHGWPIGVIDATPVRHLRPVATDYPRDAAIGGRGVPDGVPTSRAERPGARGTPRTVRIAVVAEYYPRADPTLGVWAARQALAPGTRAPRSRSRAAPPVPPRARPRRCCSSRCASRCAPDKDPRDVRAVPCPPRPRSCTWGAWAARRSRCAAPAGPFDLVHAHYAVPAGDAVRRARLASLVIMCTAATPE
jgi:hypothetical protein